MNLFDVNIKTTLFSHKLMNVVTGARYYFWDYIRWKKRLRKNIALKNQYSGETCYILGNGPSLANVDLNQLSGKHVMTVNLSINTPVFDQVNPEFHVIIDRARLTDAREKISQSIKGGKRTSFILHRAAYSMFGDENKVYYGYVASMPTTEKIKLDLTGSTSAFLNVLPYASMCAMYMGFKKIVLLGNDFSFFTARRDLHFYDKCENEQRKESLYQDLAGCAMVLLQYRFLYKFAKKNGIELVNATEGSLLDEIPQVQLGEVLI